MFFNFDFPIARPLFYSVLIMPAHLFGSELLSGTLEYSGGFFYKLACSLDIFGAFFTLLTSFDVINDKFCQLVY